MISPRSFKYSSLSSSNRDCSSSVSSTFSTPTSASTSLSSPTPSPLRSSISSSYFPPTPPSLTSSPVPSSSSLSILSSGTAPRTIPTTASTSSLRRGRAAKYDTRTRDFTADDASLPYVPTAVSSHFDAKMAKRKERRDTTSLSPTSHSTTTTDVNVRPTTPTSPVQIPKSSKKNDAHFSRRHAGPRRRGKEAHTPVSLSPSMAALLAVTDIPRPRHRASNRKLQKKDKPLTVEDIFDERQVSEKELSWTLSRSTMGMLLTPPEHLLDDDMSISDSNIGSAMSIRTISVDSIPSLGDSFNTEQISSLATPSRSSSRRRSSGPRRSLEPVSSPPEQVEDHPLAFAGEDIDAYDTDILGQPLEAVPEPQPLESFKPLRAVFKSNLTASLRALRSAAKSFSVMSFPSIPSDDLSTRSLLSMDPKVPYTDERMPPISDAMPPAEVRRYLNPTTSTHHDTVPATLPPPGSFSASIQMQTYKIQRSPSSSPTPQGNTNTQPAANGADRPPTPAPQSLPQPPFGPPGVRQREMRENPDFIRIAVMEMAMRKRGKLDDQRPGRARLALPPRKTTLTPYSVNRDGVPERWVPVSM